MNNLTNGLNIIGCSRIFIIVLSYLYCTVVSCSSTTDVGSEMVARDTLQIDVNNVVDFLSLDDYIDSIEIVPLEESSSSPIGAITKVIYINDHYVIVDREITFKAFVFDKKGKYVKNLVETGQGPGECFQINDCWINNKGDLQALDYASRQIFTFNENLNLTEYIRYADNRYLSVSSLPGSDVILAASQYNLRNKMDNNREYLLALVDTNFQFIKGYFPVPQNLTGASIMMGDGNFFRANNTVKYFRTFENNIYNVDPKGNLSVDYHLAYSQKTLNLETFYNLVQKEGKNASFATNKELFSYSFFYSGWSDLNRFISFYSIADSKRFFTLYDKKNRKITSAYNIKATINNIDVMLPFLRFKTENLGYAVFNTVDEGVTETDLYKSALKGLPEGTFVLLKITFKQ